MKNKYYFHTEKYIFKNLIYFILRINIIVYNKTFERVDELIAEEYNKLFKTKENGC